MESSISIPYHAMTLLGIMETRILRVGVIDVAPMSSPTWPPVSTNFRNRSHDFTVVPCHSLQKNNGSTTALFGWP